MEKFACTETYFAVRHSLSFLDSLLFTKLIFAFEPEVEEEEEEEEDL